MPGRNRPIGRGRIPFRRGKRWHGMKRRPVSWHDGLSTATIGTVVGAPWAGTNPPTGVPAIPNLTLREVLAGGVDALYLDRQEVRIDRIVGDIAFRAPLTGVAEAGDLAVYNPPVVRWGLVVEEDPLIEDAGVSTITIGSSKYNLWEAKDLAETEWMYLSQPEMVPYPMPSAADQNAIVWQSHEHVDIRVKRKLGKADRLWLVTSYANGVEQSSASTYAQIVYMAYMLRCILVA